MPIKLPYLFNSNVNFPSYRHAQDRFLACNLSQSLCVLCNDMKHKWFRRHSSRCCLIKHNRRLINSKQGQQQLHRGSSCSNLSGINQSCQDPHRDCLLVCPTRECSRIIGVSCRTREKCCQEFQIWQGRIRPQQRIPSLSARPPQHMNLGSSPSLTLGQDNQCFRQPLGDRKQPVRFFQRMLIPYKQLCKRSSDVVLPHAQALPS